MNITNKNREVIYIINDIDDLEYVILKDNIISDFRWFLPEQIPVMKEMIISVDKCGISKLKKFIQKHGLFNHKSRLSKEYWLCRGYSMSYAMNFILNEQCNRARKFVEKRKKNPEKYQGKYPNQTNYWTRRGFSLEDARLKVSKLQPRVDLDGFIERHGKIRGQELFTQRNKKWINKLYHSLSPEEKIEFNKKKMVSCSRASQLSLTVFLPLIEYLKRRRIISENDYYLGYENKNEYWIRASDNTLKFYDFCIPSLKKIIEFNGPKFHIRSIAEHIRTNPFGKSLNVQFADDVEKIKLAEHNGYKVLILWGDVDLADNLRIAKEFIENE